MLAGYHSQVWIPHPAMGRGKFLSFQEIIAYIQDCKLHSKLAERPRVYTSLPQKSQPPWESKLFFFHRCAYSSIGAFDTVLQTTRPHALTRGVVGELAIEIADC